MSGITSLFQYDFMVSAFIAVLIITPLFGILGTMIVNNKMAFFSDALGHSALTGIAVGVVFGIPDTNLSMVIFGIAFALLLNWIKSKSTASTDTIISVFSSCCIAIGLAILSRGGNFSKYSSLLVGDILSITRREIVYLFLILLATSASVEPAVIFNPANADPISAAGAASTPKINCGDVENSAKIKIGKTDPYSPYTAGKPAICAYPMEIGMETAIMISPARMSFPRFFLS